MSIVVGEYECCIERVCCLMRVYGVDVLLIGVGILLCYFIGVLWGVSECLVVLLLMLDGDLVLICFVFEEGLLDAVLKILVVKYLWEEYDDSYVLVV